MDETKQQYDYSGVDDIKDMVHEFTMLENYVEMRSADFKALNLKIYFDLAGKGTPENPVTDINIEDFEVKFYNGIKYTVNHEDKMYASIVEIIKLKHHLEELNEQLMNGHTKLWKCISESFDVNLIGDWRINKEKMLIEKRHSGSEILSQLHKMFLNDDE